MAPQQSLKQSAKANRTQLGDPVSLKAETSDTQPIEHDKPNKNPASGKTLKQKAEAELEKDAAGGRSQLGDPISLKAETSTTEPTDDDRGALGTERSRKSKL